METLENTQKTEPATLNIQDLALVLRLIDICSKRGAFEGAELADVGQLRTRIAAFIEVYRATYAPKEPETLTTTDQATDQATDRVDRGTDQASDQV